MGCYYYHASGDDDHACKFAENSEACLCLLFDSDRQLDTATVRALAYLGLFTMLASHAADNGFAPLDTFTVLPDGLPKWVVAEINRLAPNS